MQTLEGGTIKERTLGIDLFGKPPDYDTAAEPVVRVTAAEIRKRLSLYYREVSDPRRIRITLPAGAYTPQFAHADLEDGSLIEDSLQASVDPRPAVPTVQDDKEQGDSTPHIPELVTNPPSHKGLWMLAVASLAMVALFLSYWGHIRHRTSDFWAPVLASHERLLFCIPDEDKPSSIILTDAHDLTRQNVINVRRDEVVLSDLSSVFSVARFLQAHDSDVLLRGDSATTLNDLRRSPAVLFGSFNNPWTLRLTRNLRFHFANDQAIQTFWIEDRNNPADRSWTRKVDERHGQAYSDYALVARFIDPDTKNIVIVVSGLGHGGTAAAGEFLSSRDEVDALIRQAPRGWSGDGVEAVLENTVIGEQAGAPHIVASYFW